MVNELGDEKAKAEQRMSEYKERNIAIVKEHAGIKTKLHKSLRLLKEYFFFFSLSFRQVFRCCISHTSRHSGISIGRRHYRPPCSETDFRQKRIAA